MTAEIEEALLAYIEATYLADEPDFGLEVDESLIDADVLDSLAMFEVAEHLSVRFGVTIDDDDVTLDNFESVATIAALVRSKLAAATR